MKMVQILLHFIAAILVNSLGSALTSRVKRYIRRHGYHTQLSEGEWKRDSVIMRKTILVCTKILHSENLLQLALTFAP